MAFDEMITGDESPRPPYDKYFEWYNSQDRAHLIAKSRDAENIFRKTGITFAVYGHARANHPRRCCLPSRQCDEAQRRIAP